MLLLHSSHLHAEVLRLDDDRDSERVERLLYAIFDLRGESLLHLQTACECVDNAWYFAEPRDIVARNVANMRFSEEGKHVVFAERVHFDVFNNNHLLILLVEHGGAEYLFWVFVVALEEILHSPCDALGRFDEALSLYVFSNKR